MDYRLQQRANTKDLTCSILLTLVTERFFFAAVASSLSSSEPPVLGGIRESELEILHCRHNFK